MGSGKFKGLLPDMEAKQGRERLSHGASIDKIGPPLSIFGAMPPFLKDKIAIVTGAGRGIGRATAQALASQGCRVVLVSRTLPELENVQREIQSGGGDALLCRADISDESSVQEIFARTRTKWGGADILVNNAAIFQRAPFIDQNLSDWEGVMAVNVRGTFLCSREIFRACRSLNKPASIVNIASLAGVRGTEKFPGLASYVTSKFAVIGLTEALAIEGRPLGIRVNCLAPGAVETQMLRAAAPDLKTQTTPEQVAKSIVHLADASQSGHLSGSVLEVFSNL
jgi:NAD(P)-dependent dehydrogenase (short-subunit alcohol dehydrogenase family)